MKIIMVDDFDRETEDDVLIAENVKEYYAKDIVNFLNKIHSGNHAPHFYKVVADDYVLFERDY